MLVEAGVDAGEMDEAADEESGDNKKQDGKCDLADDERTCQRASSRDRGTAAAILECGVNSMPVARKAGRQPKSSAVRTVSPRVKASTGRSGVRFNGTGSGPGVAI